MATIILPFSLDTASEDNDAWMTDGILGWDSPRAPEKGEHTGVDALEDMGTVH